MLCKIRVDKIGRKWLQVVVIGDTWHKKAKLLIDDYTMNYLVGDIIEGDFIIDRKFNRKFRSDDWYMTYMSEEYKEKLRLEEEERKRKIEIERLLSLVDDWKGYIVNYHKEYGKWYKKGEMTLIDISNRLYNLGCVEIRDKVLSDLDVLRRKQEEYESNLRKYCFAMYDFRKVFKLGDLYFRDGVYYKVVKCEYIPHVMDSLSLGGWEDNQSANWLYLDSREVTKRDIEEYLDRQKELIEKAKVLDKKNKIKDDINRLIRELINYIMKNGVLNKRELSIYELDGDILMDSLNVYGGGYRIVIIKDKIWYIVNNGMDGDDWSRNTIITGGAGAYGYYCKIDKCIEDKVRNLKVMM